MFIIGFARFYEGVHSLNQIVYGWSIGLWIAFYFHLCFRDMIIEHVEWILLAKNTDKIPYAKYSIICALMGATLFAC